MTLDLNDSLPLGDILLGEAVVALLDEPLLDILRDEFYENDRVSNDVIKSKLVKRIDEGWNGELDGSLLEYCSCFREAAMVWETFTENEKIHERRIWVDARKGVLTSEVVNSKRVVYKLSEKSRSYLEGVEYLYIVGWVGWKENG